MIQQSSLKLSTDYTFPQEPVAGEHLGSNFSLYNKSEPLLPSLTDAHQTEYNDQYHRRRRSIYDRALPLRRSTSLHIEPGTMKGLSENHSKFVSYSQDTIQKSKPAAVRPEENFQLPDGGTTQGMGLANASSEYKASFLPYDFLPDSMDQRFRHRSDTTGSKRDDLSASDSKLHNREQLTRSNLRLSGEATFEPEYKRQYGLPQAADKSRSTPQLNNIAFTGNFRDAPSEYKECYKYYDHFTKSAPIRKFDNLSLHGTIEFRPEYKESYRELPPGGVGDQWRSQCVVRKDNLSLKGEFLGREPEYSYSFRNPHIKCKPEKAKPKDNFLAMQGDMDYTPMYRCSYVDYPRSRPLVKKPVCSINLEDVYEKPPHRRTSRRTPSPIKYNVHAAGTAAATTNHAGTTPDGNKGDVLQTFVAQPEYRKAQRELMIKKRSPPKERGSLLAQKILQDGQLSAVVNQAPVPVVQVQDTTGGSSTNEGYATTATTSSTTNATGTTTSTSTGRRHDVRPASPVQLPVRIAKHGRRAKSPIIAIQRENEPIIFYKDLHRKGDHSVRNRTKVIEANAAYRKGNLQATPRGIVKKSGAGDKLKTGTQSFVVLNAPAKRRTTRWAEPATIYDSHFY
ncbi:AGAP005217-PA-like protein [Anopheles sinensis]|uniref:AGAP005217-PA-like protein n=1 Tax=Anopheles sinensis TaxID=74873 RepID=A0A084WCQ1_ANOSI|nr:AGAP005217-PA-like protein [Anopheles sinensis]